MNLNDIPNEVWWVHIIKMQGFCGSSNYQKCKEIVERYPEHFPDEAIYRKIPKEVHEAYDMDTSYNHQSVCELLEFPPLPKGDGLIAEIEKGEMKPYNRNATIKDFQEAFEMIEKNWRDEEKAEYERAKIWNKHYAKYGLYYVKGKHLIT